MTEKEELLSVFRKLGIVWEQDSVSDECAKELPGLYAKGTKEIVTVTQAIFCFDINEKFLAVLGDENGSCDLKKEYREPADY